MKIVKKITVKELQEMANKMYGEFVKTDVDVVKRIVIFDMPMHYDGEQELLQNGSKQKDIWGINLHPGDFGTDNFIEFDSMINIKPSLGNASKDILDGNIKSQIIEMINEVVHE